MSAPCNHGMPTRGSCVDCMYEEGLPVPEIERRVSLEAVAAQHDGRCGRCEMAIEAEVDRIVFTTRDRWVHEECIARRCTR